MVVTVQFTKAWQLGAQWQRGSLDFFSYCIMLLQPACCCEHNIPALYTNSTLSGADRWFWLRKKKTPQAQWLNLTSVSTSPDSSKVLINFCVKAFSVFGAFSERCTASVYSYKNLNKYTVLVMNQGQNRQKELFCLYCYFCIKFLAVPLE